VPYKSAPQAFSDLASGEVSLMFYPYLALRPQIESGRLRLLGNTAATRSVYVPDTPTMAESGFPDFVMTAWFAIYAPHNTARPIIDGLAATLQKEMADPDLIKTLTATGTDGYYAGPDELTRFTKSEIERYRKLVALSGAKVD
jgi:tripartite-type tricarboxylate transporter receptor subunit TctC